MRRSVVPVAVAVAIVAACSGGDDGTGTPASTTPAAPPTSSDEASGDDAATAAPPAPPNGGEEEWRIELEATVRPASGGAYAPGVSWTTSPDATETDGPFGTFASCSGHRSFVSPYSISLSAIGSFEVVTVWTADPVTEPGTYDAQIQLDHDDHELVVATGTVTIDEGLQAGEFTATANDGTLVEGRFECSGTPSPVPLTVGDPADGVLESVEVFALLRDGGGERITGLATDASVDVACPAVDGVEAASSRVLSASGDARLGAITAIEIGVEPAVLRLTVNGQVFESDDPSVDLADDGAAGSFAAAFAGGVTVDGAFRCS